METKSPQTIAVLSVPSIRWEEMSREKAEDAVSDLNWKHGHDTGSKLYYKLVSERELKMTQLMDQLAVSPRLVSYHPVCTAGTCGISREASMSFKMGMFTDSEVGIPSVGSKKKKKKKYFVMVSEYYPINIELYLSSVVSTGSDGAERKFVMDECKRLLTIIHQAGYFHLDAYKRNFVYDPESRSVKMIDFETLIPKADISTVRINDCFDQHTYGRLEDSLTFESFRMDVQWVKMGLGPTSTFEEYDFATLAHQ
jgi:hypothetical protein